MALVFGGEPLQGGLLSVSFWERASGSFHELSIVDDEQEHFKVDSSLLCVAITTSGATVTVCY